MLFNTSRPRCSDGSEITSLGQYLGRSHYEKDCAWFCYLYLGKYYISLNGEYDSVWEADAEDIDNYNELPAKVQFSDVQ